MIINSLIIHLIGVSKLSVSLGYNISYEEKSTISILLTQILPNLQNGPRCFLTSIPNSYSHQLKF